MATELVFRSIVVADASFFESKISQNITYGCFLHYSHTNLEITANFACKVRHFLRNHSNLKTTFLAK